MNDQLNLFPEPSEPSVDLDEMARRIASASDSRVIDPNARRVQQLRAVGGGLASAANGELGTNSDEGTEGDRFVTEKDRVLQRIRTRPSPPPFSVHDLPSGADGFVEDRARALGRDQE